MLILLMPRQRHVTEKWLVCADPIAIGSFRPIAQSVLAENQRVSIWSKRNMTLALTPSRYDVKFQFDSMDAHKGPGFIFSYGLHQRVAMRGWGELEEITNHIPDCVARRLAALER